MSLRSFRTKFERRQQSVFINDPPVIFRGSWTQSVNHPTRLIDFIYITSKITAHIIRQIPTQKNGSERVELSRKGLISSGKGYVICKSVHLFYRPKCSWYKAIIGN